MLAVVEEVADNASELPAQHAPHADGKAGSGAREHTVTMILREFLFCAALALTTYGALHNSPPKASQHPPAARFFPKDSSVTDWYHGELTSALTEVGQHDISLVMYYAPWDAECMHVRREFDAAARLIGDQVHFAAINCWQPGGECRTHHNKVSSWPVIMAYTVNSRGVIYRGPRDARALVHFAEQVARPLHRVASVSDLVNLIAVCDAVAIAFTSLSETNRYYAAWYDAALKLLEYEPLGGVCRAVVTSGAEVPTLRLLLWNTTLDYDGDTWRETELAAWVVRHGVTPAPRVHPTWSKSSLLQSRAGAGAFLLVFTPLEPLYVQNPAADLVREVAMEYGDCSRSEWTAETVRLQQAQRRAYSPRELAAACRDHMAADSHATRTFNKVLSRYKAAWHNATNKKSNKQDLYNMLLKSDAVRYMAGDKTDTLLITPDCHSVEFDDIVGDSVERSPNHRRAQTTAEFEPASRSLAAEAAAHACRLLRFAASRSPVVLPLTQRNYTHVRGLACSTNSSLRFVLMDSLRSHHFAESLGIDVLSRDDKTAVVILDAQTETQHELRQAYGEASLRDFVRNHTLRRLPRALRSVPDAQVFRPADLQVLELTSATFESFVNTSGQPDVLLLCGGACPSHATVSALAATRLLAARGVRARVARLDATRHDLPWHYTAHKLPALLVLPADRERGSRMYPARARVTVSGVAAMVARTLGGAELRLHLAMCNAAQYTEAKRDCLAGMRERVSALIENALRRHRRSQSLQQKQQQQHRTNSTTLLRVSALRDVYWTLHALHASHLGVASDSRQMALVEALNALAHTWSQSQDNFS